ncbi:hypothetical protein LOTGIDRAFT_171244 [Lottia gigantea]|uniref:HTH OST-type domain-containing protein n=1 Tax=Lottia gigantea TaxID=225164 RepID=V4BBZ1_LOTGI|nr:hypothetical protein LOTGIDRAFT_171244 [Lottia gigantea]ESP03597.1 hypothetical protein LOTGIDRAFT_171244 [Lottia gigantea]
MASEIPSPLKKSIRAVLLSKLGGVLVSQFAKDYKALVQEQLPFKRLGFDNMEDFFTAMPDVVRLEYCKKDMAYRVFGIGDPETYMSSWIKKSQDPQAVSPRSRRKANRSRSEKKQANTSGSVHYDDDDDGPQIDDNNRYSVMYPRKKTPNFTVEDVQLKFQDTGDIATVHIIERWIFVRYWKREEAIRAYDMFHEELGVKYPTSNKVKKNSMNKSNNTSNSAQNGDISSSFGASFGTSFGTSFGGSFARRCGINILWWCYSR